MQHMEITDNPGEFQNFLDKDSKTGICLEDTIRFFDIRRILGQFETIKQSGIKDYNHITCDVALPQQEHP